MLPPDHNVVQRPTPVLPDRWDPVVLFVTMRGYWDRSDRSQQDVLGPNPMVGSASSGEIWLFPDHP
jgi:hypothetical protein